MNAGIGRLSAVLLAGLMFVAAAPQAQAIEVAVVEGGFYTADAHNFLNGLPGVNSTEIADYTVASLMAYDFVLHYGNSFYDQAVLEAYVFSGGNLIATPWMNNNNGWFNSAASPIDTYDFSQVNFASPLDVTVTDAGDPYLAGVAFNNGDEAGWEGVGTLRGGATSPVMHNGGGGHPAFAYMPFGDGMSFYANFHYITSDTTIAMNYDWGQQLLENIILVPEPASVMMLGLGGMCLIRRRR